jgi:Bacterial SH3 domain
MRHRLDQAGVTQGVVRDVHVGAGMQWIGRVIAVGALVGAVGCTNSSPALTSAPSPAVQPTPATSPAVAQASPTSGRPIPGPSAVGAVSSPAVAAVVPSPSPGTSASSPSPGAVAPILSPGVGSPSPALALATASPAPAADVYVANTSGGSVYLRRSPHEGDRADVLPEGTHLTITGPEVEGDGQMWYPVRTDDGTEGFVPTQYTARTAPTATPTNPQAPPD